MTDGISGPRRPNLRRVLRYALLAVAGALVVGIGYGGYLLVRLAPIGTAYAAKTLCSGVFVSGRDAESVVSEDIRADNHPLLRAIRPTLDRERRIASATLLGFAQRDAVFRPGRGCTLAIGVDADRLRSSEASDTTTTSRSASLAAVSTSPALERVADWAFSEPDREHLKRTRALLVMQNDKIVLERYAAGFDGDMPLLGWSMTKSVTAALIGILVRDGKLSPAHAALLPEWRGPQDPRAGITLDHCLRMISGLSFTENHGDPLEDVALMLFARPSAAAYAIAKPLAATPGTRWSYSSGTSNILARVLRDALGGSEKDYLNFPRRALFSPIGMDSAVIETDASGLFVASSYMYASARDWASFGELLLHDGVHRGKRILAPGWVQYMVTLTPQSTAKDYGAHLWVKVPPPFDSAVKPGPKLPDAFHAVGHEGQFVSVIPSRNLVVVRLGLSRGMHVWNHEVFLSKLLEALPH